ncbi:MAG: recombinase family protein [Burkholderia gladioli]
MATYGYTRVSTAEQADGTSLDEQARKITALAEFRGETLACLYRDAGVSGSVALEDRPQGAELVRVLRPGDVLICAKLDRAFRDATDALTKVKAWKDRGVRLILADLGTDPVTENGVSKLFFTILAGFAEWERDRIRERTAEGRRAKKDKGGHIGGRAPFGYRVVGTGRDALLEKDPETFPALETIYECADAGVSLRKTSALVALRHGCKISHIAVNRILADRAAQT